MLKRVVVTNYLGESMEYKIDGVEVDNPSGLIITSIDGLGPVKANVNMTELSTSDGSVFNSARQPERNIVINALFTHPTSIEEARLLTYKYFPVKEKVHLLIETDNRTVETDGYVESNEPDIFSEESGCQISILCEDSCFDDVNGNISEIVYRDRTKDIDYNSNIKVGIDLELYSDERHGKTDQITITKDGNEIITIDPSKMNGTVSNTSPENVPTSKCSLAHDFSYGLDKEPMLFLKELPDVFGYHDRDAAIINIIYDEPGDDQKKYYYLHIFIGTEYDTSNNNAPISGIDKHYSLYLGYAYVNNTEEHSNDIFYDAPLSTDWVEKSLPSKPSQIISYNSLYGVFQYNNEIYAFYDRNHQLIKYNSSTDTWSLFIYYPNDGSFRAVTYNGELHLFSRTKHYKLVELSSTNWSWNLIDSDIPSDLNTLSYFGSMVCVAVDDEYDASNHPSGIHIFGGSDGKKHYKWKPNEGYTLESTLPYNFTGGSVIFYYPFGFGLILLGGSGNPTGIYIYLGDGLWGDYTNINMILPYRFRTANGDQAVITKDKIYDNNGDFYIIGSVYGAVSGDVYSETPNNTCFINGDKIKISTSKRNKKVQLIRDDTEYNIINTIGKNPYWFEMLPGTNTFKFESEPKLYNSSYTTPRMLVKAKKKHEGV